MRRLLAAGATSALLIVLVACGRAGGSHGPQGAVEHWLSALAGAEEDRGLSQVAGFGFEEPGGGSPEDRYLAAATATDWDGAGLEVAAVRPLSSSSYSATVLASGSIPDMFRDLALGYPVCDGDRAVGVRLELYAADGDAYYVGGSAFYPGIDLWDCGRDEFAPGEAALFGDGLSFMNNSEIPVSVTNALGRDLVVPPCTTQMFREFPGPLALTTSLGPLGSTNGSEDPNVGTRFIVVGDREIYDELGPPVDPFPPCGGEPPLQQP